MTARPLPSNHPLPGGKYRIVELFGKGGFSFVYLGTNGANQKLAIKEVFDDQRVLRAPNGVDVKCLATPRTAAKEHAHQCRRAHEEFELFGKPGMQHPGLVRLIDCFDAHGTTYLIMPFVSGEPFYKWVANRGTNAIEPALEMFRSIASVLEFLHQHGMIHRDLKPENVLVTQSANGASVPVVLDTGATRTFLKREQIHTGIMTAFGSPEISGPEEARWFGAPGPASDCFSLAGLMYLCFAKQSPPAWGARFAAINEGKGTDPLAAPADLPPDASRVLLRALSLKVENRQTSPSQMVEEFARALKGETMEAAAPAAAPLQAKAPFIPREALTNAKGCSPAGTIHWMAALLLAASFLLGLASYFPDEQDVESFGMIAVAVHLLVSALLATRAVPVTTAACPFYNIVYYLCRRMER